ncbi:hypothetical protein MTR67_022885 [Solanum verrucosum]|uniref:Reverse transcriptase zinc-binding domain-containing protein n=1 Tax=Solanum verrucosum TaxID=315347 RepID=A0AAF0TX54_SOLVR|nr:hypothetical protein MTR67_022885 [Solanum verrucosum]
MHPELAREKIDNKEDDNKSKEPNQEGEAKNKNHKKSHKARINQHTGSFPRKLASGKLVGNLEDWNEVTNKRKKALVDEVIDIAAGDIIENLAGKIIPEDASQSLENIQDDENKTEHIKDIGEQEDSDNTTREEEVQVANNLQLAVIQEEDTVFTISNKALIWNFRSVKSHKAFPRVQSLHRHHNFAFVAILEPFQHMTTLNRYKTRFKMSLEFNNVNGKIWIFVNLGYEPAIVSNSDQQITLRLKDLSSGQFLVHNSVYAKCHGALRQSLWEEIFNLSQDMTNPWSIWGNFNVVLNEEEKIWGLPINYVLADDFKTCIDSLVTKDDNEALGKRPEMQEVKNAIFNLNGDSACGPDGLTGRLFQACWDIVGYDILKMVLSAIVPLACVIKELNKIFAKFFWNNKEVGRSKHWAAWEKVCLPKEEGGLGFRSIADISKAMYAKLWWKFRTQNSLWANFLWNKYCKKQIPTLHDKAWWTKNSKGTFTIKSAWELLRNKEEVHEDFSLLWRKGLPFKISFLNWRIWKGKLPVGQLLHSWSTNTSSDCSCCHSP